MSRHQVVLDADKAARNLWVQVIRRSDGPCVRRPYHRRGGAEWVRQVEYRGRDSMGHGGAIRQALARASHGRCHLQRLRIARSSGTCRSVYYLRYGSAPGRCRTRRRALGRGGPRGRGGHSAPLPWWRKRVPPRWRPLSSARYRRVLSWNRGRLQSLRHHRARADWVHRLVTPRGSAHSY